MRNNYFAAILLMFPASLTAFAWRKFVRPLGGVWGGKAAALAWGGKGGGRVYKKLENVKLKAYQT